MRIDYWICSFSERCSILMADSCFATFYSLDTSEKFFLFKVYSFKLKPRKLEHRLRNVRYEPSTYYIARPKNLKSIGLIHSINAQLLVTLIKIIHISSKVVHLTQKLLSPFIYQSKKCLIWVLWRTKYLSSAFKYVCSSWKPFVTWI